MPHFHGTRCHLHTRPYVACVSASAAAETKSVCRKRAGEASNLLTLPLILPQIQIHAHLQSHILALINKYLVRLTALSLMLLLKCL